MRIGDGTLSGSDKPSILQQRNGRAWIEIARFASGDEAGDALDRAVAAGAPSGTLRVVTSTTRRRRILNAAGVALAAVVIGLVIAGIVASAR